jgi:shikimate dehydrogenase
MIRLGLTGCPLDHSLSPALHGAALQACGMQGSYSLFPIPRDDIQGLRALLEQVRAGELTGLNITIPHKQNVFPLVDELTPPARAIGAVNTIYLKEGKLIGDNTDAPGFMMDLNKFLQEGYIKVGKNDGGTGKSALILGAGGAARAVAYALAKAGWSITIASRRIEQAREMANSHWQVCHYDASHIGLLLPTFHLIVNATPVGMFPNTAASPWRDSLAFPKEVAMYDLIYNPRETQWVRQARAAGLLASTGIGMLVEQAALAFQLWTGQDIPRSVMFDALDATEA